ncbi:hypothetical protein LTR53_011141, partial [Teratosphaeriaceae sp. CCFEE 6253]
GRRCHNPIAQHNQQAARRLLGTLPAVAQDPSRLKGALEPLASLCLCRRWHQDQRDRSVEQWTAIIRDMMSGEESRHWSGSAPASSTLHCTIVGSRRFGSSSIEPSVERRQVAVHSCQPPADTPSRPPTGMMIRFQNTTARSPPEGGVFIRPRQSGDETPPQPRTGTTVGPVRSDTLMAHSEQARQAVAHPPRSPQSHTGRIFRFGSTTEVQNARRPLHAPNETSPPAPVGTHFRSQPASEAQRARAPDPSNAGIYPHPRIDSIFRFGSTPTEQSTPRDQTVACPPSPPRTRGQSREPLNSHTTSTSRGTPAGRPTQQTALNVRSASAPTLLSTVPDHLFAFSAEHTTIPLRSHGDLVSLPAQSSQQSAQALSPRDIPLPVTPILSPVPIHQHAAAPPATQRLRPVHTLEQPTLHRHPNQQAPPSQTTNPGGATTHPHPLPTPPTTPTSSTCAICLQPLTNAVTTPCAHTYCRACVTTWLITHPSCPLDRRPLYPADLRSVAGTAPRAVLGECGVCFEALQGCRAEELVYCRAQCGNHLHKVCFETWAVSRWTWRTGPATCPYCRVVWER